jgi:hypothetical protein
VARLVAARYLVAAFAFMAAATWFGVGLKSGFGCLFVFVLALQVVRLYQRRSAAGGRRTGPRRERRSGFKPVSGEETELLLPVLSGSDRSRPSRRVFDSDREEFGWPVASEAIW